MRKLGSKTLGAVLPLFLAVALTPVGTSAQEQAAPPEDEARQIEVTILGMSCPFCAYGAEQKLKRLEGVEELTVELEAGLATLTMVEGADVSNEVLQKTVEKAGFEVAKITRNFESEYPEYVSEDG